MTKNDVLLLCNKFFFTKLKIPDAYLRKRNRILFAVNITYFLNQTKKPNLSSIPTKQVTEMYKYLTSKRLVRSTLRGKTYDWIVYVYHMLQGAGVYY